MSERPTKREERGLFFSPSSPPSIRHPPHRTAAAFQVRENGVFSQANKQLKIVFSAVIIFDFYQDGVEWSGVSGALSGGAGVKANRNQLVIRQPIARRKKCGGAAWLRYLNTMQEWESRGPVRVLSGFAVFLRHFLTIFLENHTILVIFCFLEFNIQCNNE